MSDEYKPESRFDPPFPLSDADKEAIRRGEIRSGPPDYGGKIESIMRGMERQPLGWIAAFLSAWTNLWLALALAAVAALGGALVALVIVVTDHFLVGAGGIAFTAVFTTAGAAFVGAFAQIYGHSLLSWSLFIALIFGFIQAGILTVVIGSAEPLWLRLRGYRRLSRREHDYLDPIVDDICRSMGTEARPTLMAWDHPIPGAWTHIHTIVLSSGLGLHEENQTLDREELAGVLAHELHHWFKADAIGLRFVWAMGWPVVALFNLGVYMNGGPKNGQGGGASVALGPNMLQSLSMQAMTRSAPLAQQLFAFIVWAFIWPTAVLMRLVIAPAVGLHSREHEYEADAAAAALGHGAGLTAALVQLAVFDPPRTGWESVLHAQHPPVELRLEALETPAPESAVVP